MPLHALASHEFSHAVDPETGLPLDLVFIESMRGETVIGIDHGELHQTQPLVVDVHAGTPRVRACDTDQIGDTIHYGHVRDRVAELMQNHRFKLLESFAERVAEIVVTEFGAHWVRVKVVKPNKFADVQAVGVQIERRRADFSLPTPARAAAVLHLIGSGMVPGGR